MKNDELQIATNHASELFQSYIRDVYGAVAAYNADNWANTPERVDLLLSEIKSDNSFGKCDICCQSIAKILLDEVKDSAFYYDGDDTRYTERCMSLIGFSIRHGIETDTPCLVYFPEKHRYSIFTSEQALYEGLDLLSNEYNGETMLLMSLNGYGEIYREYSGMLDKFTGTAISMYREEAMMEAAHQWELTQENKPEIEPIELRGSKMPTEHDDR